MMHHTLLKDSWVKIKVKGFRKHHKGHNKTYQNKEDKTKRIAKLLCNICNLSAGIVNLSTIPLWQTIKSFCKLFISGSMLFPCAFLGSKRLRWNKKFLTWTCSLFSFSFVFIIHSKILAKMLTKNLNFKWHQIRCLSIVFHIDFKTILCRFSGAVHSTCQFGVDVQ